MLSQVIKAVKRFFAIPAPYGRAVGAFVFPQWCFLPTGLFAPYHGLLLRCRLLFWNYGILQLCRKTRGKTETVFQKLIGCNFIDIKNFTAD